jgi:hypothetical protein
MSRVTIRDAVSGVGVVVGHASASLSPRFCSHSIPNTGRNATIVTTVHVRACANAHESPHTKIADAHLLSA